MQKPSYSAVILAALEGEELTPQEKAVFLRKPPAGFTLFKRNLAPSFIAIKRLTDTLQSFAQQDPLIIAIDQEGGRVARLKRPFPDTGPALGLADGRQDQESLLAIENEAFTVGASLASLGINCNFAPVLDILSREDNPSIGDRCFGRDADAVQMRAGAYLKGLQAAGVFGCLKHFPGQGHGAVDTHEGTAWVDVPKALLEQRELAPFRSLAADAAMVMISHAVYPELDHLPASLSPKVMQRLLKDELGFKGLVVSDDMNMKAIGQSKEAWTSAIVKAIYAGADLVLVCRDLEKYLWAVEAIEQEASVSVGFQKRLAESLDALQSFRARLKHRDG